MWEKTIAMKKKMFASENRVERKLLKFRKLISHEIFKLKKRLMYQI